MSDYNYHALGALHLPRGLVWVDEFNWLPIDKTMEYGTAGALLVDVAVRQAGRTITLQAQADAGWITRSVLASLHELAADPLTQHLLTLADGREFTVIFSGQNAIAATPVARPELPHDDYPYVITLQLIEV